MTTTPAATAAAQITATADHLYSPLTELTRLSAALHRGGWATLSDRVLDIRYLYRTERLTGQATLAVALWRAQCRLRDLAEGLA
jgi:hypothetical protein